MENKIIKNNDNQITYGVKIKYDNNDVISMNKWMYEMHENITTRNDMYNQKYIDKMETLLHTVCELETYYKTYYDTDILICTHNRYDITDIYIINALTGEIILMF